MQCRKASRISDKQNREKEVQDTYMALQPLLVDATKQPSVVAMGM